MTPALEAAFAEQAAACDTLGSPFMARMLPRALGAVPAGSALAARLEAFDPDRLGPSADSVPLRLAGALHHVHLSGACPALSAVYPPAEASVAELSEGLAAAFASAETAILARLESPPQTNEVRRASVLIAAGHWLTARFGRPLILSELGCSAGLNLNWDFFRLTVAGQGLGPVGSPVELAPDWRGVLPHPCPAYVAEARGVDLRPIDVTEPAAELRLLSYLWPDQAERLALTRAAIGLMKAPDTEAALDEGDALAWLPGRLAGRAGHCHMIYSTVAWQYLPEAAQAHGAATIAEAGARATSDAPLAWFRMENDGPKPGAGLTMRLWPGDETHDFGRADFHGRWVDWRAPDPSPVAAR
ncbi:MAG: DUF2332 family protein [Pseudomonadota bacterium]